MMSMGRSSPGITKKEHPPPGVFCQVTPATKFLNPEHMAICRQPFSPLPKQKRKKIKQNRVQQSLLFVPAHARWENMHEMTLKNNTFLPRENLSLNPCCKRQCFRGLVRDRPIPFLVRNLEAPTEYMGPSHFPSTADCFVAQRHVVKYPGSVELSNPYFNSAKRCSRATNRSRFSHLSRFRQHKSTHHL